MEPEQHSQSKYILIVVVVLIILGIIYFVSRKAPGKTTEVSTTPYKVVDQTSYNPTTTGYLYKNLPPSFPTGLILEDKKIEYSGELKNISGKIKTTVSYMSDKSITDLVSLYADSLGKSSWMVKVPTLSDTVGVISASKVGEDLILTISALKDKNNIVTFQYEK